MNVPIPLRVLVVDDEAPARRKVLRLLRDESDMQVVGEADSGEAAVAAICKHKPDIVFLDVQMPAMDGFCVVESLSATKIPLPQIIFITAHDKFALRAFEVHAFDYLLKPVSEERFRKSLGRVREQRAQTGNGLEDRLKAMLAQMRPETSFPDRLLIHENERAYFVAVRDISWIEAERNYLLIHCGKKTHTLRGTLDALEKTLDPKLFVRLNRGNIARLDAIRELAPWFHGEYKVFLQDNTELRWSRRYVKQRPELRKMTFSARSSRS
jgi:two-component system LytT family response regulator